MSEQRLSVTFGAFSCDVVGYDDPFAILNRVVELFSDIAKDNPEFGAGAVGMTDLERARVAAGISDQASRIEEMADASAPNGTRYVITNENAEAAQADDATPVDTPAEAPMAEDPAAEDEEIVIADAVSTDATGAGDLELRDTLRGLDTAIDAVEVEATVPDAAPESAPAAEAEQDVDAAIEAALDAAEHRAEQPAAPETTEPAVVAESALLEEPALDTKDQGLTEDEDLFAPDIAEPEAEDADVAVISALGGAGAHRPLRLAVPDSGLQQQSEAPKAEDGPAAATPEPAKAAADSEQPESKNAEPAAPRKPRVTVTRLPLRPQSSRPRHEIEKKPQTLTPVQKVEPVVTLSSSIADDAATVAETTRAERIRAKMERRNSEDDGDNFLFADVDEAVREAATDSKAKRHDDVLPLTETAPPAAEPTAEQDDGAAPEEKKHRRSLAGFLGFGKSSKAKPAVAPAEDKEPNEPSARAATEHHAKADGFDRLRESVAAAMPMHDDEPIAILPASSAMPETISEAIDYDDETSPTAFARRVGANTLQDLLEASAVYMSVVEGKSKFSRRDVMQALNQIGADKDYTQEARLKSFRKLLTSGSLVRVDDGMFTLSQATRFGYETQLQA